MVITGLISFLITVTSLRWCHNGQDGISNHQPRHCLLNCLFGCRSKKHQSSVSLAFARGIHRRPVNSRHKWPVTWKMFPFDDVIMVIMSVMASQIICVSIVYPTVCSSADQRKHQSSVSLAFVRGIDQWLMNSQHKGLVTWKMFWLFDDVIMSVPLFS